MFDKYTAVVERIEPIKQIGRIRRVQGLLLESDGPQVFVGELCQIVMPRGNAVWAEAVGVSGSTVQLMPYTEVDGIEVGCSVVGTGEMLQVPVSDKLLGRVLDARGRPIDGAGDIGSAQLYPAVNDVPHVLDRSSINEQMVTGVRAIDGLIPVGKGQRLGIFSGSGVGKSTLLGMIARNTEADVNVIALIGERGREVREFIEQDLGPEGLARSVVVVSTSNTPPLARLRGAYVATAIAEYYRDQGKHVMLLFDSVTRFARAQREIGLAIGEPPATRGFTPSVFSTLPKLLERCGTSVFGTITGFYNILVEGDDMDEPIADAVRGILDGHLVLARRLAQRYHYPAIDVLSSISRLATRVASTRVRDAAGYIRRLLAAYTDSEDLINVGAYQRGTNREIDEAIEKLPQINGFLRQDIDEKAPLEATRRAVMTIAGMGEVEGSPDENAVEADTTAAGETQP
ncbi:MAG: FliI/YscN family ATPase [Spirochaetaceae bacterium]|nr:MAG: FliI/YscN family ATPase [Spirochaetaceae bacterium]